MINCFLLVSLTPLLLFTLALFLSPLCPHKKQASCSILCPFLYISSNGWERGPQVLKREKNRKEPPTLTVNVRNREGNEHSLNTHNLNTFSIAFSVFTSSNIFSSSAHSCPHLLTVPLNTSTNLPISKELGSLNL